MESSRSLARVILEMRDDISKLESENRALRGGGRGGGEGRGGGTVSPVAQRRAGMEENPSVNLRRNASAPDLEGQYKENTVMTVRRYSISSSLPGGTMTERTGDPGWGRLHGHIQHRSGIYGNSARGEMEKVTNRHSLQEYIHKDRTKGKTVTFLLPVDDIYTNRPVLTNHQDGPKVPELDSITKTDS
ncbi:putative coiled-coil domain-containing protein 195 [Spinachia spinachia]